MKKVLLGCLVLLIVGSVVGTLGFYFFVYRSAGDYVRSLAQLDEIRELNERIENRQAYSPPADGRLQRPQVDRFVAVQRHIRTGLGIRLEELEERYAQVVGIAPSVSEMLGIWRDFSGLLREAKALQVEGLNREGFSLEEYQWVRGQVYRSLGMDFVGFDIGRIAEVLYSGEWVGEVSEESADETAKVNRALVEPYEEELRENVVLAMFGL